jgi:hypothetical protein
MRIAYVVVGWLLATGCVEGDDPSLSSVEAHAEAPNRLAVNALSANRLAVNRLSVNGLSAASADLTILASDDGGRELLSYLISCALPADASVTVGDYAFFGQLGLARTWIDQPLRAFDRRWVSACLLARVNYFGVSVRLSLRGPAGQLTTSTAERATYPLFEGAFWGDIFAGAGQDKNACSGRYKATAPQVGTMPLRECTVPDGTGLTRCGFTAAGVCEDICVGTIQSSDRYETCAGAAQVISVYLEAP